MTDENSELVFPMTWDKCPVCGSNKRVSELMRQDLIKKGKWREEMPAALFMTNGLFVDPGKLGLSLTAPMLLCQFDVCAEPDCGAFYCVKIDRQETRVQANMGPIQKGGPGQGSPGQIPPPFPQKDMRAG